MAATIRLTCTHSSPVLLEWAEKINRSFHPPHALVDGQETPLHWGEPVQVQVESGKAHKLEVYFSVFDVFRMCGAEVETGPLRDGETRSYKYIVHLTDRYLNRGELTQIG